METVKHAPAPRTRSRLSLLMLLGVFAAPVVLAWLAFYVFPEWRPAGTSNNGQLVTPIRPLPAFQLETLSGEPIDETFMRGKWTLVYLMQGPCAEPCVTQLYNLRQVRLAQGKNIDRVQRLMLWDGVDVEPEQQAELVEHFPGQVIGLMPGQAPAVLVETFVLDEQDPMRAGRVYLVDPLGNLMMNYQPGDEPRGMIKDLERLLKYSGLG
jgi:cytochrome oxidase Cu insertion factor (SCO1/SenC/PrrC family)